ncbi:MAG: hypothetical protein D6806_07885 [Deltaproteobacteria bacterium]|nr:MAG: hypothetical protein D6806_07885 [Deltaproteobacteria bacterium]
MALAGAALLVIGGLIVFMLHGDAAQPVVERNHEVEPTSDRNQQAKSPAKRIRRPGRPQPKSITREQKLESLGSEPSEKQVLELGKEFHQKWYADRERLGPERHKQMERLWWEGRRPRGSPESIAKLEKLLEEYPDTNRAGCAAYELGQHYVRNRALPLDKRRKMAEHYWLLVDERYRDSLCEYNAPADGLAKLALVNWVYRYTDPAMARRLLEEIIEKHKGETDHLGQPLEQVARRMLQQLDNQR